MAKRSTQEVVCPGAACSAPALSAVQNQYRSSTFVARTADGLQSHLRADRPFIFPAHRGPSRLGKAGHHPAFIWSYPVDSVIKASGCIERSC